MNWYSLLSEMLDLRSFSNLWYWIALAVLWSSASHWVMGVPYDIVTRARRGQDGALETLRTLALIHARRLSYIGHVSGAFLVAIFSFALTALAVLGFVYWVEFAQAIFLLMMPMFFVGLLNLRLAARVMQLEPAGETLCGMLGWQRFVIQLIGVISITITVLWGMYMNISIGVLGH